MADKKISQLTALSAANLAPSTDVLAIVDTSATETKKIVAQDLINGVLNVASAVGIGTATPGYQLTILRRTGSTITAPLLNLQSQTSGSVDGDSFILFGTQTANWSAGVDQADSNKFRIEPGNGLGGADGLTITTAGNLGIGTASPSYKLHVVGGAAIANRTTSDTPGNISLGVLSTSSVAQFGWRTDSSNNLHFDIYNGASWSAALTTSLAGNLGLGTTTNALTYALTLYATGSTSRYMAVGNSNTGLNGTLFGIDGSGNTVINNTQNLSMLFLTNNTERARFNSTGAFVFAGGSTTANGIGITFPATQSASTNSNTLDDYEEGTFTPTFVGSTTNPTYTTSEVHGSYTKIGRVVYFSIGIVVNGVSAQGTGGMQIGGLPFTVSSTLYSSPALIGYNDVFDTNFRVAYALSGDTRLQVIPTEITQGNAQWGSPQDNTKSNLSTGYFAIQGFYYVS